MRGDLIEVFKIMKSSDNNANINVFFKESERNQGIREID